MSNRVVKIEQRIYQVELTIKRIKNSYLRVSDEGVVRISTSKRMSDKDIIRFISKNKSKVDEAIDQKLLEQLNQLEFISLFGKKYDIDFDYGNGYLIDGNQLTIKTRNSSMPAEALEKFKVKFAKEKLPNIFYEVLSDLKLNIEKPTLQVRKMKTRWGVCHVSKGKVVLNSELVKYDYEVIRYVIIHELMHFFEPNHSKEFWKLVENLVPDYKNIRQSMK